MGGMLGRGGGEGDEAAASANDVISPFLGEFFATFLFFVALHRVESDYVGLAIMYMMMVATFGKGSGSHLNPTLSLAKYLVTDQMTLISLVGYLLAQILGNIAASFVNSNLFADEVSSSAHGNVFDSSESVALMDTILGQMLPCALGAGLFVYFALVACYCNGGQGRAGILGFAYSFGHLVSSEFNPAVSFSRWFVQMVAFAADGDDATTWAPYKSVVLSPICCAAGVCVAVLFYNLRK